MSRVLFEYFSLNMLEVKSNGRNILIKSFSESTEKFLKQDLSILNEPELVDILSKRGDFGYCEKILIKVWASLFESKRLFELAMGKRLSDKEFEVGREKFVQTEHFERYFQVINWAYMFIKPNNLIAIDKINFYENVALSMIKRDLLTVELIEKFNLMRINWNYRSLQDETVLIYLCCTHNKADLIHCLLDKGVDINIKQGDDGVSAFTCICLNPTVTYNTIKLFVDKGVDVDARDMFDETAFMVLCLNESVTLKMLRLFFDEGVDISNQGVKGQTAFMNLCENKSVTFEMLELFIGKGVDIALKDIFGNTAFIRLSSNETVTVEMLRLFLDRVVDSNLQSEYIVTTAFMNLCENKSVTFEMLELFLDRGVDIAFRDEYGRTALHKYLYLNICGKNQEILKLLGQD